MRGQAAVEFLFIVSALLVVLAVVVASFLTSSSSLGSNVSGEIENIRDQAVNTLKSGGVSYRWILASNP